MVIRHTTVPVEGSSSKISERPGTFHDARETSANTNDLRGKILRIKPRAGAGYTIPRGNLFRPGTPKTRPEIYAMGLRNPFRNSFDRATGNLLIADVGQGAVEEVNLMRPTDGGANYGWNLREGTRAYNDTRYRNSAFYDLAKASVLRLAFAQGVELAPHGCTAVALTPGWMRSEMMLEAFGITESRWHDALDPDRTDGPVAPPGFAESETPRYIGRAVAAVAAEIMAGRPPAMEMTMAITTEA